MQTKEEISHHGFEEYYGISYDQFQKFLRENKERISEQVNNPNNPWLEIVEKNAN
jgi:hypothetical protein